MIQKGMTVYDNWSDKVGPVELVRSSKADSSQRPVAAAPPDESTESDVVDEIRRMFSSDK